MTSEKEKKTFDRSSEIGIGVGVVGGVISGLLMGNLAIGIPVGIVVGAGIGSTGIFKNNKKEDNRDSTK